MISSNSLDITFNNVHETYTELDCVQRSQTSAKASNLNWKWSGIRIRISGGLLPECCGRQSFRRVSWQEAQLSQRDRAALLVIEYFAKSLKITQGHSKRHCWVGRVQVPMSIPSQVNDVPRTQTGHSLYVRITINILHITSILFHVKLRSASGSDQVSSVIILKFLIFPKPIKSVFECINRSSLDKEFGKLFQTFTMRAGKEYFHKS